MADEGSDVVFVGNRTSSVNVKRRGKAAVMYVDKLDSDDAADFVVVDSPRRRSRWMDVDLDATEQRSFICTLTPQTLGALEGRFGRRLTEGRAVPRRCLVDLVDLAGADDDHKATADRLFLVVEEMEPPTQRPTSASGHVACRFVEL